MSSMVKPAGPRKGAPAKPKPPRHNPARALNDRDWRRKQAAQLSASRPASVAGSPPPPPSAAAAARRPPSQCPNPKCSAPDVVDGTCQSCGAVVDDSNIVADVQFGEAANGQAVAFGVTVNHGEAGPRINATFGGSRRPIAGGGRGDSIQKTYQDAKAIMDGVERRLPVTRAHVESGMQMFSQCQLRQFLKGRTVHKVVAVCLYWAVRRSNSTPVMLIDIADAFAADVFALGRVFKKLLELLYGKDCKDCPFEPIFPEDIIKSISFRLGFDRDSEKIADDAVRIVQRMDRDWIVLGRKPAGICGSAVILAARMNNYRRTPLEVSYVAKVTKTTLQLRLDEFAKVGSAQLSVTDFRSKEFINESHDPPAFYRGTKEYQDALKQQKASRKRKRGEVDQDDDDDDQDEAAAGNSAKTPRSEQTPADNSEQPGQLRTDADGFAVPPLPSMSLSRSTASNPEAQVVTQDDISEAMPSNAQDQENALASKYGDVPMPDRGTRGNASTTTNGNVNPGAKTLRNKRQQGSSLKEPVYLNPDEEWTAEEKEEADNMLAKISDHDSDLWVAAASYAGIRKQELLEKLESTRPVKYHGTLIDRAEVTEDEFADDPEVLNCLLNDEERKVKEQLWLNENKEWLRVQQEKAYKEMMAPPKKPRKNNRKARIGEGQLTPASSASEAAIETAKRLQLSKKIDYSAIGNMLSRNRGPGSVMGSEVTSQQTSRAGSEEAEDDDGSDGDGDVGEAVQEEADMDDDDAVDEEDQYNNDYEGDEFGGDEDFGGGDDY